jgi:hypothetical protein
VAVRPLRRPTGPRPSANWEPFDHASAKAPLPPNTPPPTTPPPLPFRLLGVSRVARRPRCAFRGAPVSGSPLLSDCFSRSLRWCKPTPIQMPARSPAAVFSSAFWRFPRGAAAACACCCLVHDCQAPYYYPSYSFRSTSKFRASQPHFKCPSLASSPPAAVGTCVLLAGPFAAWRGGGACLLSRLPDDDNHSGLRATTRRL